MKPLTDEEKQLLIDLPIARDRILFLESHLEDLQEDCTERQALESLLIDLRIALDDLLGLEAALFDDHGVDSGDRFQAIEGPDLPCVSNNMTTLWPIVEALSDILPDGTVLLELIYEGLSERKHVLMYLETIIEMIDEGTLLRLPE